MKPSLFLVLCTGIFGQAIDPVQWTLTSDAAKARPGSTVTLKLTATIAPGWHIYSPTTPQGGKEGSPIPTTVALQENAAVEASQIYQPKPERKYDENFKLDV